MSIKEEFEYIRLYVDEDLWFDILSLFYIGQLSPQNLFDCVRWVHKYRNLDPLIVPALINGQDIFSLECGEKESDKADLIIKHIRLYENILYGSCAYIVKIDGSKQYFIDGFPTSKENYLISKKLRKRASL